MHTRSMPELPEVEALAHFLRGRAIGRVVDRVDVAALSVVKTFDPPISALQGRRVERVGRVGKYLLVDCDGLILVLHFARAGWLKWSDAFSSRPMRPGRGPLALRVHLGAVSSPDGDTAGADDTADPDAGAGPGETGRCGFDVTEAGSRKSLAAWVVSDPRDVPGIAALGPDAGTVDAREFAELVAAAGARRIRTALTDQTSLAGIGGAYSDEILHRAQVSPFAPAEGLSVDAIARLHTSMHDVLAEAIRRSLGDDATRLKARKRDAMAVHGRSGEPCPVCGDTIRQVSYEERSLEYCPTCQTGGRILADRRLSRLLK